jgi:glycolate oxidase iron-sulfur subunit
MSQSNQPNLLEKTCADCIQCGACKAVCPVYLTTRREEHSPRGKLNLYQALLEGGAALNRENLRPLWQCLLCGRCQRNCPNQLKVTDANKQGRAGLLEKNPLQGKMISRLLLSPSLPAMVKAIPGKQFFGSGLNLRWPYLNRLPALRSTPPRWRPAKAEKKKKIGLFPGCMATYARPGLAVRELYILQSLKYEIVLLNGCCGLAALSAGQRQAARQAALRLRQSWQKYKFERIVTLCTSCAHALREEHPALGARNNGVEIVDINILLSENSRIAAGRALFTKAYLHISCHLQPVMEPQQWLLASGITDLTIIDYCCGGGGLLPFNSIKLSQAIPLRPSDPSLPLLTTCSGCYGQWLQIYPGPVLHPLEAINLE